MKTITYNEFGGTGVLQITEEPKPAIRPDQVLVKVKAVSINPLDWKIRKGDMKLMSGSSFPKHTGTDFAGIVAETGSSVSSVKTGDEVFGIVKNNMKEGALGEYVAVPATHVWKKPTGLSFAQAASIPTVGFAAMTALDKMGRIDAHSQILVNGAAGGFGMFLLQLLKRTGATVTAVVGTNAVTTVKQWGADVVIDYQKAAILAQPTTYDVVVDLSGKLGYEKAKSIMKPASLFLNPIPDPLAILSTPVLNLFRKKKQVVLLSSPSDEYIDALLNAVNNGLSIEVSRVFPFAQSKEAYDYTEAGGYIGKIGIEVN